MLIDKIEELPSLPESIIQLEEFSKQKNADPEKLMELITKDPLIVATILKIANSSVYGFRSEIDTLNRAINLLGTNFTISIAIGCVVQNTLKGNLAIYGVSNENFIQNCALASKIVGTWISPIDFDLKEELLLPAFLQETGKFIISSIVQEKEQKDEFLKDLEVLSSVEECELKYTDYSCARITANVFKHWHLNYQLIFAIGFIGDIQNCPKDFKKKAKILEIIKILTDIRDPLNDSSIERAIQKAQEYGFDVNYLINCIEVIKNELSSNT